MSKFSLENQGAKTFLVYTVQPEDQIDSMSLGMLTNNHIPGLAPTLITQLDSTKFIKYDISGKTALTQFFTGAVNRKRLLGAFNGIVDAMLNAEEYMIEARSILLDCDHIYADVSTCETELICIPLVNSDEQPNLIDFFKQIMYKTQFDQAENLDHVARIINYLNSAPVFSLPEFKSVLKAIESGAAAAAPIRQTMGKPAQPSAPMASSRIQRPGSVQPTAQQPTAKPVPPQNIVQKAPQVQAPQPAAPAADGPEISLYYLLQHYNKDNAAAYKAQKEARKAAKAEGKNKPKKEKPEKKKKEKQGKKEKKGESSAQTVSYAVPGVPVNYAVPGQKTAPAPAPDAPPAKTAAPASAASSATTQKPQHAPSVSAYQPDAVVRSVPGNFGETVVLNIGGDNETTVLTTAALPKNVKPVAYLIRCRNNERVPVNKPVFRIGKERSYVDYFIADNSAISRSHANIFQREDRYFIMDTSSKNHTFVDGTIIPSNTEIEIVSGTKLRLANEDFEFKIF